MRASPLIVRTRFVPFDTAPAAVTCPAGHPLLKGEPAGQFTCNCRRCRKLVEVTIEPAKELSPAV